MIARKPAPKHLLVELRSLPPDHHFQICRIGKCEIVLALIGRDWIGNADQTGRRRLDNPKDFVRVEICAAVSRSITVVPVLLDGAPMPEEDQLPEDMRLLVRRQAESVGYHSFEMDVDRLIKRLGLGKQTT
jgi:hypothetical protein